MLHKPQIRTWAKSFLPRRFHLDDPVCQVYVRDDVRSTRFTFLDFPSFFSPSSSNSYFYDLAGYRSDGTVAGREEVEVGRFATRELDIEALSFAGELTDYGLFTAQIRPRNLLAYNDRHLGRITAQFYALYYSRDWSSLALVHPQTVLASGRQQEMEWTSGLLVEPRKFQKMEVFQINPTRFDAQSTLALTDSSGNSYAETGAILPPFGSRRVVWESAELPQDQQLRLTANCLAALNGKPLVFFHFQNGLFSGSHT